MSTFKKLVLILSSSFMGLQSDAMWLRRPLMVALAKRQTAIRIPIKAAICTQSVPAKRVVRYVQPRRSFTFKSNKLFNTPRAISFKRLVATSVALGTLCATTRCEGSKTEAEHPIAQYQAPFEESRKKFYQDLESKPWGEVSKKYIKALQEEEQKLMDELCSILKMDANEFKYIINHLLPMFLQPQYRKAEFEDEGGINFLKQRNQKLPQNLVNQMNSLLMQCSIDPQKIILLENNWNNCSDASASQSSIKIAGKLVGAFDENAILIINSHMLHPCL